MSTHTHTLKTLTQCVPVRTVNFVSGLTMENTDDAGENEVTGFAETSTTSTPTSVPTPPTPSTMHTGLTIAARLHQGTRSLGPTLLEKAQGGRAVEIRNLAKRRIQSE